MKKRIAVLVSTLALVALTSMAQAATNRFAVQNGTVDTFTVTDTGWLGVGLGGVLPLSAVSIMGKDTPTSQVRIQNSHDTNTTSAGVVMFRQRALGGLPIANDRLGYLLFGTNDSTTVPGTFTPRYSAGLFAYADGIWSATSTPSYYTFETTKIGSTGRTEWMRITSSGYVGVGNPFPNMHLEVNGGLRLNPSATLATVTSGVRVAPTKPVCDATNGPTIRGTLWFTNSAAGVADLLEVCQKDVANAYSWKAVY